VSAPSVAPRARSSPTRTRPGGHRHGADPAVHSAEPPVRDDQNEIGRRGGGPEAASLETSDQQWVIMKKWTPPLASVLKWNSRCREMREPSPLDPTKLIVAWWTWF